MKRELALRLLQTILPDLDDEGAAANLFRELQFMADYKYNKYEMYHPGRLFLENLYLWLQQFEEGERSAALGFVREKLIFISRQEFQQLAGILYHDIIKPQQFKVTSALARIPSHRIQSIRESRDFKKVTRATLYVGMSDGARIDHIRRQNLEISNEQVLPYYDTSSDKAVDFLRELQKNSGDEEAKFRCLFLLDDFCGSGRTLLREVVSCELHPDSTLPTIQKAWQSRLRIDMDKRRIELLFEGELTEKDKEALLAMGSGDAFGATMNDLIKKYEEHDTILKGSLYKVASGPLGQVLSHDASIFFCPLLATEYALNRVRPLLQKLPCQFSKTQILPGAVIESRVAVRCDGGPISNLCEKYYTDDFGDQHTGSVKYGFDGCGLPLILHHNTPNNSVYLLWARKRSDFNPLFVRYERHGREGA